MGLNMATRVPVEKSIVPELPKEPIGKVHKRIVVGVTNGHVKEPMSIRAVFDEMLKKNAELLAGPNQDAAIDLFADLFVNEVKEEQGWHGQVTAIANSLEQNDGDKAMQKLGYAIKYHADQTWAARHVDSSKRSG